MTRPARRTSRRGSCTRRTLPSSTTSAVSLCGLIRELQARKSSTDDSVARTAVYFEQGNYDKAIETCEKAVEEGRELRADYKLVAK